MHEKTIAAIALSNRDFPSLDAKLKEAARWVQLAGKQGADLAVLPELLNAYFGDGAGNDRPSHQELAFHDWQKSTAVILDAARDARVAVVVPVMEHVSGGRLRNCFYLVDADGRVVGSYGKMFPTPDELEAGVIAHGAQPLLDWQGIKVGGAICFDTCFSETFEAQRDADLIIIPSLWPGGTQLEHAARQHEVAIALAYPAWSRIIDYTGRELAATGYRNETLRFGFGSPIAMATVNFDHATLYANHNQQKMVDVQQALGDQVRITFDQPNCTFYLESRSDAITARQICKKYGLIEHQPYFEKAKQARDQALSSGTNRQSPVVSLRRLVADGRHNAFTSMCYFKGDIYLTYRTGTGHGIPDGDIAILRSSDKGETWQPVESPARDTHAFYEGHLCEHAGKLLMYSGTFKRGDKLDKSTQQEYVSWTEDGKTWHGPEKTYEQGWRFWQPIVHDDAVYVAAYRVDRTDLKPDGSIPPEAWEVRLLRSEDGRQWQYISDISLNEGGNETELYVDENNVMHAYIRSAKRPGHLLHRSADYPYAQWTDAEDCGFNCEGQQVRKIHGRLFLAGRHRPSNSRIGTIFEPRHLIRTRLWVQARGYWVDYAQFPSNADNSYPAMLAIDDKHMLLSYYSQHAYVNKPGFTDMDSSSDIYLAVIRTDAEPDWGQLAELGKRALKQNEVDLQAGIV